MPDHTLQMLCSWLPLSFGGVTYYTAACPAISYFLATGEAHAIQVSANIQVTADLHLGYDACSSQQRHLHTDAYAVLASAASCPIYASEWLIAL